MIRTSVFPVVALTALAVVASAQSRPTPAAEESGFTSYLEFGGTSDSDGQIYEMNTNVGYDFTPHFGLVVGAPIYFVRPSSTTTASSANGLGNPYLGLRLKYPGPKLNFGSALIGAAPVGDSKRGLSTGRATFDWTNRVDRSFTDLTPFVELGIANTTPESRLFLRPYTTLGFNTHVQGGASYDVWRFVSVGASGYDIQPSGEQTVFSRVTRGSGNGGRVHHGRVFENNQQTRGGASIAQDDGFSAFVDANPGHNVDLELGFTRSVVYDLNSVSFSIGINLGHLYRRTQK